MSIKMLFTPLLNTTLIALYFLAKQISTGCIQRALPAQALCNKSPFNLYDQFRQPLLGTRQKQSVPNSWINQRQSLNPIESIIKKSNQIPIKIPIQIPIMRPCKIQCTFYCHHVVKNIAPLFVYVGLPPLGSK